VGSGTAPITLRVENVNALDEVVVIGYGEQSRKDLVGSVGVVSRKNFGDLGVSNSSQLLQGKVAGVQVINNSGAPGSGAGAEGAMSWRRGARLAAGAVRSRVPGHGPAQPAKGPGALPREGVLCSSLRPVLLAGGKAP
jgi:hypothetical protein